MYFGTTEEQRNRIATDCGCMGINEHITDHIGMGSYYCNHSLGIQEMPSGYALMLSSNKIHFYWLRHDGTESAIHWDKWAVYHGAMADSKQQALTT